MTILPIKTFFKYIALGITLISSTVLYAEDSSSLSLTAAEAVKLVEIDGSDLSSLYNEKYKDIQVFAIKYGRLVNIPSQFNEYDQFNHPYFKKGKEKLIGTPDVIDEHNIDNITLH